MRLVINVIVISMFLFLVGCSSNTGSTKAPAEEDQDETVEEDNTLHERFKDKVNVKIKGGKRGYRLEEEEESNYDEENYDEEEE